MRIRDQDRARQAYTDVSGVPPNQRPGYKIAVNSFGTYVLREGLAAALAWIERDKNEEAKVRLIEHLAHTNLRVIGPVKDWQAFCKQARAVPASEFMLATRDLLIGVRSPAGPNGAGRRVASQRGGPDRLRAASGVCRRESRHGPGACR